jgi:hypothetical protein
VVKADGVRRATYVHPDDVEVHVDKWNHGDRAQAAFQVAHELVHVLSQPLDTAGLKATRLEEGLAAWFSQYYTFERYLFSMVIADKRYEDARDDTAKLLVHPNVIREIRERRQPVISRINASDITEVCRACAPALAQALTRRFCDDTPPAAP